MSAKSRGEVLEQARERYGRRGKEGRSRLLDEICALCGYERKYAIKVLGGVRPISGRSGRPRGGSVPVYGEAERAVIKAIWLVAEQPCGKRLRVTLVLWLPYYEKRQGHLPRALRAKLLQASPATIDRLLAPCRVALGSRRRYGTRPGTLLRSQIPIRTEHWEVSGPGFIEADTVAHCGESMAGEFCWSITATDVHTQWTETRAVWNRGEHAVQQRIAQIEAILPFAILGFDTDNGSEFLNWHLANYFLKRPAPVHFTRARPYRKNDNARVEQKNWTHVRQLVGYGRFEGVHTAELLNDLYAKEWSCFRNFFCPVMKHLRTEVEGSRKRRIYDQPATPFERLKASAKVEKAQIVRLENLFSMLDPFALKEAIETKLRASLRR
ncbi:hypothetical protein BH20VER3_BH20VER3_06170 [soil metagenome]